MERLESRMDDATRSDRKEMKHRLNELDEAWKNKPRGRGRSRGESAASGTSGVDDFDVSQVPPEHIATLRRVSATVRDVCC